jgi:prepilin-type N-terminal cleavage/methylation domain-containing protein
VIEARPHRPYHWRAVRRSLGRTRTTSSRPSTDEGFTLIELLVVILILPIVVGALAVGLIAVFSIQGSVSTRVADSGDAQVVSSDFETDVQSAQQITTDSTASQCGSGTQLLGLESNPNSSGVYETVISYNEVRTGSTTHSLVRNVCLYGASSTPTDMTTVSFNIKWHLAAPVISPSTMNSQAQVGWVSAQPVTNVQFNVTEPEQNGTSYTYDLSAIPEMSSVASTAGNPLVSDTNTTCGFAPTQGGTQSNGTYATTLCFVDFSSYNASDAAYPDCQTFVAYIPGGDILKFCMSEQGNQPMVATALPTYPEAFLGNTLLNGDNQSVPFYTGLGCGDSTPAETGSGGPTPSCINPAMYQTDSGFGPENTLDFTGITVTTPTGAPATGWEFVSADAETTDSNEYITWTSNVDLTDLPDTVCTASDPQTATNCGTAWWGNTCDNEPNWNGPQGFGTVTVTCQSGSEETSATKTGTPMVEALTPLSMSVTMKGAGLEGIAVGLELS